MAAARALHDAGWQVVWCASLGMAKRLQHDTAEPPQTCVVEARE